MDDLKVFVYGSLKVGQSNCIQFCSGYTSVEKAFLKGKMFQFPTSGFPVVTIPDKLILAVGTKNPWEDVKVQSDFSDTLMDCDIDALCLADESANEIQGDLFTFADPEIRLPEMDWFEGYRPGRRSYYKRVLTYVCRENRKYDPAWIYIMGEKAEGLVEIPSGIWNGMPEQ